MTNDANVPVAHEMTLGAGRYTLTCSTGGAASPTGVGSSSTSASFDIRFAVCFAPADLNLDEQINVIDLLAVIGAWGACPAQPGACVADIDDDGQVAVTDLLAVVGAWGD